MKVHMEESIRLIRLNLEILGPNPPLQNNQQSNPQYPSFVGLPISPESRSSF